MMQRVEKKRVSSDSQQGSASTKPRSSLLKSTRNDGYCWVCHRDGVLVNCVVCPRSYHLKCGGLERAEVEEEEEDWVCPECDAVLKAENVDSRSAAMKSLTVDQLCSLLKFTLGRLKSHCPEEFQKPVPLEEFPNYPDFVVYPMDLETMESNVKKKTYGCTESFLADIKWILHNCIIFNGYQHKLTGIAKNLVKLCKHEMNEIEVCPDCYYNAYTKRENWFQEPCCPPHLLIWAKLKGFPFWPAKAMKIATGMVDVRFFGAHDRAWIPVGQCFLLSSNPPASMKMKVKRKGVFEQSMDELAGHIVRLKENYNAFQYASSKASIQSEDLLPHVETMLPGVDVREIRRSFTLDRVNQPRFYCPGKFIKSESGGDEEMQLNVECYSGKYVMESQKKVKVRLECKKNLEHTIEKIKAIGKEGDGCAEQATEMSESKADDESEKKMDENGIKIHLKRAESSSTPSKEVWEAKTEISEPKHVIGADEDSVDEQSPAEFEETVNSDLLKDDSVLRQGNKLDVNLGNTLDSILDEDDTSTVHIQLAKSHLNACELKSMVDELENELILEDRMVIEEEEVTKNEEEKSLNDANQSVDNSLYTAECMDESNSGVEGDLVIDLDREPTNKVSRKCPTTRQNANSSKKSPFGGIKLREKKLRPLPAPRVKVDMRPIRHTVKKFANKRRFPASNVRVYSMLPKLIPSPKGDCNAVADSGGERTTPKLLPRPSKPATAAETSSDGSNLSKYSRKVADFMHGTLEEMFRDLASSGNSDQATIQVLQLEMEKMRWWHNQEIVELKHNNDLVLLEMRNSMEYEKQRAIAEIVSQCQLEKQKAIEETKRKQWCAYCGKEAFYYCCWNTSYCDYPCQQAHWPQHNNNCTQQQMQT